MNLPVNNRLKMKGFSTNARFHENGGGQLDGFRRVYIKMMVVDDERWPVGMATMEVNVLIRSENEENQGKERENPGLCLSGFISVSKSR